MFQSLIDTPAIGVAPSTESSTTPSSSLGLRALNDYVIIEEEPIELTHDKASGLTEAVVEAIKGSKLVIPDSTEFYANKFPFRGSIVAAGPKVNLVKIGERVMFARLGGQRWTIAKKQMITIHQDDIHAILD